MSPVDRREAAREMRAAGRSVSFIAERFGVTAGTVSKWTNPETATKAKAGNAAWRDANRDHIRRRDVARYHVLSEEGHWGRCACGRPLGYGNASGECKPCQEKAAADALTGAVAAWVAGETKTEVAARLGGSTNALNVAFVRLRAAGYPVPRRRPGRGRVWIDPLPTEPIIVAPGWAMAGDIARTAA